MTLLFTLESRPQVFQVSIGALLILTLLLQQQASGIQLTAQLADTPITS